MLAACIGRRNTTFSGELEHLDSGFEGVDEVLRVRERLGFIHLVRERTFCQFLSHHAAV